MTRTVSSKELNRIKVLIEGRAGAEDGAFYRMILGEPLPEDSIEAADDLMESNV